MLSTLIEHNLFIFGVIGSVVAAISGALFAAEKRMDILGFILIGAVTGLGGGSLRDFWLYGGHGITIRRHRFWLDAATISTHHRTP